MTMKSITQEDMMGCGIACVSLIFKKSYQSTKKLFDNPEYASTRGYYCRELVKILNKNGLNYTYSKINNKNKKLLKKKGIIIFIKRSKKYPAGHYLVKINKNWMDPWINFNIKNLEIKKAKAGFRKRLTGEPQWVIYSLE